jgi:hypothetical protein
MWDIVPSFQNAVCLKKPKILAPWKWKMYFLWEETVTAFVSVVFFENFVLLKKIQSFYFFKI